MKSKKIVFSLEVILFLVIILLLLPHKKVFADVIAKQDQHNGQISGLLGTGSYNIQTLGSGLSGFLESVQLWTIRYGNPSTISVQILCYNESSYSTTCTNSSTSTSANVSTSPSQITLTGFYYQLYPTKYYMIKANVSDATNQTIIYGVGSGNLWPNGHCWYPESCQTNAGDYYFILNSASGATPTPSTIPTPTPTPSPTLENQTDWIFPTQVSSSGYSNENNVLARDGNLATCTTCLGLISVGEFNKINIPDTAVIEKVEIRHHMSGPHTTNRFQNSSRSSVCFLSPGYTKDFVPSTFNDYIIQYTNSECNGWLNNNKTAINNGQYRVEILRYILNGNFTIDDFSVRFTYTTPTPTSTPTPSPTPSTSPTPAPFLDLPWDYQNNRGKEKIKTLTFDEAAMAINSWFDHTYPFLSSGIAEPPLTIGLLENYSPLDQVTTFRNIKSGNIYYSTHDGYDYGRLAQVNDGDPVFAAASGTASASLEATSGGGGNVIKIDHGNGYQTWYEHLYADELFVATEGAKKDVVRGEKIGKVGHTGNCWSTDASGKKIYNTPDCAHIHFSVIHDKNNDQKFNNLDLPYGMTDPYGWEPEKNEEFDVKDPWLLYSGATNYYLWNNRLKLLRTPVSLSGTNFVFGPNEFRFPPGIYATNFNTELTYSPYIDIKINNKLFKSILPSISLIAYDSLNKLIKNFLSFFTLTINFTENDMYNIKPDTLSVYSSQDLNTWTKENTTVDPENHIATATANHATYFALMGEIDDTQAPITKAELTGTEGKLNSFRSDTTLAFNTTDDKLGVDYTLFKKENSDWETYTTPFLFTDERNYKIQFYSRDNGRNVEDVQTIEFHIDKTPPTTTAKITTGTKGNENWYISDASIELTASDEASGVAQVNYSIDNGQSYQKYTDVVTIEKEGINKFLYYSEDNAGNKENAKELEIKIDKTPPDTLLSLSWTKGGLDWYGSNVLVSFNATDDTSGSPSTFYKLDNEKNFTQYSDTIKIEKEGATTITYYSIDEAGNIENQKIKEIKIDKTPPVVSINASPNSIWPPNGKMVDVKITGNSSDSHLKTTTFHIKDEYNQIQPPLSYFGQTIQLEAKRNGDDADGRVYAIQATAEDLAGNTTKAITTILVPHDQRK